MQPKEELKSVLMAVQTTDLHPSTGFLNSAKFKITRFSVNLDYRL